MDPLPLPLPLGTAGPDRAIESKESEMTDATGQSIISSDSHVLEPHDLWQNYSPKEFHDRVPRLVRGPEFDRMEGEGFESDLMAMRPEIRGESEEDIRKHGRWEEVFQGGYDPHQRVKDLETDGVDAEVLFPTTGMSFYPIQDDELRWTLFRAYNTWLHDFCSAYPDKFKGIAILDDDVDQATAELERCREMGHVGAMVPLFPSTTYRDRSFDRLWECASELQMPLNLHSSTFRDQSKSFFNITAFTDRLLNTPYQVQHVLFDLMFSGVFDRFPTLKVVSTENDAGWAGHMAERGDYWFHRQLKLAAAEEVVCTNPPSFYLHRNVFHAFMRDRTAVLAHEVIGTESLMWGNDFPHYISTWPYSQELIEEYKKYVDPPTHAKIFCDNVRALYQF
jgi:predicted TIM-barrel fold metal-dependent hydrolase